VIRQLILISLALSMAAPASADIDPGMRRYVAETDGGLSAVLRNDVNQPLVTLRLGLPVGRLHDPERQEGMAKLLSRALTETRAGEVEALGGQSGAYVTSDHTVFWVRGLSDDFEKLLGLLIDTVAEPRLGTSDLARARDRLRGELRLDRSMPGAVARRRLMTELFGEGHPLGRQTTRRSLGRVKPAAAEARLARFYGASGAHLVVVGNIDRNRFSAGVTAAAGRWPPGELLPAVALSTVSLEGPRTVRVSMKGLTQSSIVIGWPGIARTDPDWEKFQVFNHVLGGGGFASRLMQAVRVEEGRTYSIRSSADAGLTPGPVTIATATASIHTDGTISLILEELERLLVEGITDRELTDARQYLLGRYRLAQSTPDGRAGMMISARMLGLGDDFIDDHLRRLESVDAAGALDAGRRFFDAGRHVLVVVEDPRFSP